MAFPTIPTVAAGRVLSTLNTAGGATKTFPNLSSLTKNAGDLLIAIAVTYDGNSTNAEFSSWGGGFTEFKDQATTTTMGIGCAYKWSTGSETGTFTVTTADTSASDSVMWLISIPGAHASTPPEASNIVNGTAAAANVAAFDPSGWAAEDTLWILVGGSGEDATTGSFTGMGSGDPTNYTSSVLSGITADVFGGVESKLSFRQVNASSEDPPTFSTVDVSNARNSALLIAVRPAPPPITSGAYETSLSNPAIAPEVDTGHSVTVRAWQTAGSGTLLVRLLQGATQIDSWSETLTGSAADYNHSVTSGNAANITDYNDLRLEFKIQGVTGLTARVSQAYMTVPQGNPDGAVAGAISWVGTVTGTRTSRGDVSGAISWVGSVTGVRTPKGSVSGAVDWVGTVDGVAPAPAVNGGTVSGAISWVGTVTGTRTPKGSVSGAVGWAGSVTGKRTPKGAVSGAVTWGSGVVVGGNLGFVQGAISWVGTVTGDAPATGAYTELEFKIGVQSPAALGDIYEFRVYLDGSPFDAYLQTPRFTVTGTPQGVVSGNISWSGSVTGTRTPKGAVTGAVGWAGSVTGTRTPKGAVTGAVGWAGSVTGSRTPKGSASGAITWGSGVVIGGNLGFVSGSISWVGSVTGRRTSSGSVSGAVGWVGTVNGVAPAVGINDGSVEGAISWVGTVNGVRVPKGAVSGAVGWVGSVTGETPDVAPNEGAVAGSISWVGTVNGKTARGGSVSGAISWIGFVQGIVSGLIVGFIVGDNIDGPATTRRTFAGPHILRTFDGPNTSRIVDGPNQKNEALDGPVNINHELDGPETSRVIDGPETSRVLTGPET